VHSSALYNRTIAWVLSYFRAASEYYNEAEEVDGCGIATFGAYY
jgi:hypothetical protein